ncbi:hypothetical protein [Streptomyces sp. NBC_01363]|uniref:hypothetical protein n=1 Tax=Streptomyces sp. NBC_01363 TaxID=2903840 RepID=UPI00225B2472|nr:hypothetical protein [Streptomyces sp. NBC_01363]MCX4735113.1 hypothetical protein [Streptomyces sp. NBC_01363]
MSRFSRARLNDEADYFTAEAKRSDAAALDGDRAAADMTNGPRTQAVAAKCAQVARSNATDYRNIAAALRDGEIPDCLDLD